jgi:polysaccharide biosynthesis/export protein
MTGVLVALVLSALQAQEPAAPVAPQATASHRYAVGPEDVLKVTVFNEPDLSKSYRVDGEGDITFAWFGSIPVQGKSVNQIAQDLTARLAAGYLRNPQVSVEVEQYRSRTIFVLGEVKDPGMFSITGEVTLLEAITKAGSFSSNAGDEIRLSRPKDPTVVEAGAPDDSSGYELTVLSRDALLGGTQGQDVLMQDGDRIVIPEAKKFYIMGHVRSPGYYPVYKNMTVQQAIAVAGGLGDRGSDRRIKARRRLANGEIKEISLRKTDLVQADDTIVIGARIF